MKELGPEEGINRLRHPDCRACKESERVNVGLLAENVQLKKKLAGMDSGLTERLEDEHSQAMSSDLTKAKERQRHAEQERNETEEALIRVREKAERDLVTAERRIQGLEVRLETFENEGRK